MDNIERLYEYRIAVEMEELGKEQLGTDGRKAIIDDVTKMTDRLIELRKLEIERNNKAEQLKADKRDRLVKNCLTGASIGLPLAGAFVMGVMSMNFQRDDVFITEAGKGAVKSLLKFKI